MNDKGVVVLFLGGQVLLNCTDLIQREENSSDSSNQSLAQRSSPILGKLLDRFSYAPGLLFFEVSCHVKLEIYFFRPVFSKVNNVLESD